MFERERNGVHAEPVWNPNDTPAATIREQTENTPHMLHGSSNNSDGYMVAKPRPVSQERDSTSYYHIGNSAAANGTAGPRTYDADYNARTNANREAISKVNRYNVGNQSLAAYDQNVTNLRNRATKPSEMRANMPKGFCDYANTWTNVWKTYTRKSCRLSKEITREWFQH